MGAFILIIQCIGFPSSAIGSTRRLLIKILSTKWYQWITFVTIIFRTMTKKNMSQVFNILSIQHVFWSTWNWKLYLFIALLKNVSILFIKKGCGAYNLHTVYLSLSNSEVVVRLVKCCMMIIIKWLEFGITWLCND